LSISVTNSKSPITVVDDKVTVKVASGVGPQGAVGPQGPEGPAGAGYSLPAATSTARGGIVVGDNLTVDDNGRLSGQQGGVTLLNGQTGVITIASAGGVTAAGGTITIGYVAPPVSSVAGRTGAITLTTADVSGYAAPPVTSVAGRTGAVTIAAADVSGLSAAAPVQSVAGRTGAVTLSTADISGYTAPPVTSVAGRTGAVTLSTSDVSGYVAPAVTSVAGRTGAVTIAAADVSGLGSLATQSGTFSGTSSGTNTGDQTISLTGDVTGSGTGSFAVTIAAGAVITADIADGAVTLAKTTGLQKSIAVSSAAPSGGSSGDLYVQTSAAGQVTPATLTADANDYAPSVGDIYRLSSNAARNITGWTAWSDGTVKLLVNVGVNNITLKHQSASSSASNRFITPTAGDYIIAPGGSAAFYWDATDSRVRVL
jgi:hypothetical protein